MGHKELAESIWQRFQVSHFERQSTPVMTSYKPFGFSKVAYGHDLSRHSASAQFARNQ
jgi:hypothetical protein